MIREAMKVDDIGRAVSHGSILMLRADLLDIAERGCGGPGARRSIIAADTGSEWR
jgi:hypothetical protein